MSMEFFTDTDESKRVKIPYMFNSLFRIIECIILSYTIKQECCANPHQKVISYETPTNISLLA